MYRVLIVEDNYYTNMAFQEMIDWAALNCEIVGCVRNGDEGEQYAFSLQPQIVITDVRMPGLNGIELFERLRTKLQPLKVIIVTGYRNFDYAQASVKLGATDFILKPIDPKLLQRAVEKAVCELDSEQKLHNSLQQVRSEVASLSHQLNNSQSVVVQNLLATLLADSSADEVFLREGFERIGCPVAAWGMLAIMEGEERWKTLAQKVREAYPSLTVTPLPFNECKSFLLFDASSKTFSSAWSMLSSNAYQLGCAIVQTDASTQLKLLAPMCDALLSAVREGRTIVEIPTKPWDADTAARELIAAGDAQRSMLIRHFVSQMYFATQSLSGVRHEALVLIRACAEYRSSVFMPEVKEDKSILQEMSGFSSTQEICRYLDKYFMAENTPNNYSNCSPLIRSINAYLCLHYAEDITLNTLSEVFFLSRNYLSSLIKRETGKSFTSILTDIRISHAQKYLQDPRMQIHEVGQMVGYSEYAYFYQVFKKQTGLSPKEYRRTLKGLEE